ncbi:hypothetical protein PG990_014412 [Apiospora arundinis]
MVFIRPYQESDFEACAHISTTRTPPTPRAPPAPATAVESWATASAAPTSSPSPSGTRPTSPTSSPPLSPHPLPRTLGFLHLCLGRSPSHGRRPDLIFRPHHVHFVYHRRRTLLDPRRHHPNLHRQEAQPSRPNPPSLRPNPSPFPRRLPRDLSSSSSSSASSSFEGGGWRATMHIDLLPEYQRQGWGRHLIESFVRSVQASGADYGRGAWIGIAPDNAQVVSFYEKVGFRLATPPAAVTSAEDGSGGGGEEGINMVIDIPPKV